MSAQQELADTEVEGTAGGGLVTATVNGQGELVDLSIDPEAIDPEDPEETAADHRRPRARRGAAMRTGAATSSRRRWAARGGSGRHAPARCPAPLSGLGSPACSASPACRPRRPARPCPIRAPGPDPGPGPQAQEDRTVYEGVIQNLIDELGRLPGVGPKGAQRIAFHLLAADPEDVAEPRGGAAGGIPSGSSSAVPAATWPRRTSAGSASTRAATHP